MIFSEISPSLRGLSTVMCLCPTPLLPPHPQHRGLTFHLTTLALSVNRYLEITSVILAHFMVFWGSYAIVSVKLPLLCKRAKCFPMKVFYDSNPGVLGSRFGDWLRCKSYQTAPSGNAKVKDDREAKHCGFERPSAIGVHKNLHTSFKNSW